jgi:hypothetical protein
MVNYLNETRKIEEMLAVAILNTRMFLFIRKKVTNSISRGVHYTACTLPS